MPLPYKVTDINTIDETQRTFYTEKDGAFVLDIEGEIDDVAKLTKALDSERKNSREANKAVKEFKSKFEGLDADEAREALKKIHELEEKNLLNEGDVEKVIEKRVERYKQETSKELQSITSERDALKSELHNLKVHTAVADAANAFGVVRKGAMPMIIGEFEKIFSLDEKGMLVAKDDEGNVKIGSDGTTPLKISEYMKDFAVDHEYLFEASSGGNAPKGNDKNSGGQTQLADMTKMTPSQRLTYAREQAAKQKTA